MLDKFLVLLERFVVAHELIAANSAKQSETSVGKLTVDVGVTGTKTVKREPAKAAAVEGKEIPVEGEDIVDTKPEPEKKTRKPRAAKVEEKEVDYDDLRKQIGVIDDAISEGPEDKACDEVDELLEEFTGDTMKLAAIADKDLAAFLAGITKIRDKYYDVE